MQRRLHFLKGLPEAAALATNFGDEISVSCSSSSSSRDLLQDLVLAPVAWCFEVCLASGYVCVCVCVSGFLVFDLR